MFCIRTRLDFLSSEIIFARTGVERECTGVGIVCATFVKVIWGMVAVCVGIGEVIAGMVAVYMGIVKIITNMWMLCAAMEMLIASIHSLLWGLGIGKCGLMVE